MSDNSHTPQDRRAFLLTLGTAALAAGGASILGCATSPSRAADTVAGAAPLPQATGGGALLGPIGVQLYTLRDEMKRDVAATLARVARIGYKEVEFAGYFDHSPADIRAMLDADGLTAPSAHIPLNLLKSDPASVIAAARTIGHSYVIMPYIDEPARRTLADWHAMARALNEVGAEMSRAGLRLAYHNHDFEFAPIDGTVPYELLLAETDPKLVSLEMDLYWTVKAGQDPLTWFAKYPGRFPFVHVKDSRGAPKHEMVEVGHGTIDWPRILSHRAEAGIAHFVVEHDNPTDAFASIESSFTYLSRLRV